MAEKDKFLMLRNVRVSFPHLFTKPIINGDEGKCGCTLLLGEEEHAKEIAQIQQIIDDMAIAKWKKKRPADKTCLRLGEDKRDEYIGYYCLSANSKDLPVVISNSGAGVITDPSKSSIYAGCRVNAKVSFWVQDNVHDKRVNGNLIAIQFAGDDTPLDDSYVSVEKAMEGFEAAVGDDFLN